MFFFMTMGCMVKHALIFETFTQRTHTQKIPVIYVCMRFDPKSLFIYYLKPENMHES